MAYPVPDPRVVLPDVDGLAVTVDTETSGKHPDDGARVAIVSVAWAAADLDRTARPLEITSYAFPFDQGIREGKPEYQGQMSLFIEDDINLPLDAWVYLMQWLLRQRITMHPIMFDCTMIRAGTRMAADNRHWTGPDLEPVCDWDTMVANKEIWPALPVALKTTAVRLQLLKDTPYAERLGGWTPSMEELDQKHLKAHLERITPKVAYKPGASKGSAYSSGRWDLGDWDVIGPYANLDTILTKLLEMRQKRILDEAEDGRHGEQVRMARLRWLPRELKKAHVLYSMASRGIEFNVGRCLATASTITQVRDRVGRTLPFAKGGKPTIEQARQWYFGDGVTGRYPSYAWTEGKKPKPVIDAETVGKLVSMGAEHAVDYQLWQKLDTALSKWYLAYPNMTGADGRLRTVYRQCQVNSGRTSAERINLQAIPNDYQLQARLPEGTSTIWQCVAARPGYRLWGLDAAQAELRVGARWAPCNKMLDLILSGADAHGQTATDLFGLTKPPKDAPRADQEHWTLHRQVAKRANFSLIFDVGPATFQQSLSKYVGIEWPLERVKRVVYGWRDLYPEFRRAVYRAMSSARDRSYVRLINGRLSWFNANDRRADPDFHKAFNRFVQASLAEWAADYMIELERRYPGMLVLWVHDAAYLEVPIEREDEVIRGAAELGGQMFTKMFNVPGEMDAHIVARSVEEAEALAGVA